MSKLDLKDAYISVLLNPASRKLARFLWSGKLYESLCLCFGLRPAPRIFTKLIKIPVLVLRHLNIPIIIYLDDMLLIDHTIEEPLMARDHNLPSSTTRVCTEFKEIRVDTYTENRVLRGDNRFINHDPVSTREESLKSSKAVSGTSSENKKINFRIKKISRLIAFHYSSSTSSTNKFQVPTATTNRSIKNTGIMLQKSDSKRKLQGRTAVVDKKLKNLQWSLRDSVSQSSTDTGGCIQPESDGVQYLKGYQQGGNEGRAVVTTVVN